MMDYERLISSLRAPWRKPENKPPEMDNAALVIESLLAENNRLRADIDEVKQVEFPRRVAKVADGWRSKVKRLEDAFHELRNQHPVAWMWKQRLSFGYRLHFTAYEDEKIAGGEWIPLYTLQDKGCTAEWLKRKLDVVDDSYASAGRPCDAPPGCNANTCLGCGESE